MNPYKAAGRGARLLDQELPRWAEIVDRTTLELDNCYRCVLGQLFGSFDKGYDWLKVIRPVHQRAEQWFGFDVDWAHTNDEDAYYDALDQAWRNEIADRVI